MTHIYVQNRKKCISHSLNYTRVNTMNIVLHTIDIFLFLFNVQAPIQCLNYITGQESKKQYALSESE